MKGLVLLGKIAAVSTKRYYVKRHACVLVIAQEDIKVVHVQLEVKYVGATIDVTAIDCIASVTLTSAVAAALMKF